jgi:hypothetical protein
MTNSVDAWRRWLGMFCLAVAAGMLIWGRTILASQLQGVGFIIYWLVCFLFTIASIVIALLDVRAMLRHIRDERADLLRRALNDIEQSAAEKGQEDPPLTPDIRRQESLEDAR